MDIGQKIPGDDLYEDSWDTSDICCGKSYNRTVGTAPRIELGFPSNDSVMTGSQLTTGVTHVCPHQAAKIDAQVVPCGAYRAAAMVPKRLSQDAKEIMETKAGSQTVGPWNLLPFSKPAGFLICF